MPESLTTIEEDAWSALHDATTGRDRPYRYLTLASLGRCDFPEARTIVLRSVDRTTRTLEFHTDTRSPKWLELQQNGNATVLGYSDQTRVQLRLRGSVRLAFPGSEQAERAWNTLPSHTRATYTGGPPGDALPDETAVSDTEGLHPVDASGKTSFGVLFFKTLALDWCRLERQNNLRAKFSYDDEGKLESLGWIAP
ncbi:pyridoxamine 5'-phosphate oxidase family protein [uncultured Roseibium sp.]|uniref:pyridoxamine 5'-phosphate oxidase family protein n=1 Tax=uncultured Roseibium sp. TaxID=1936171 RepID=UPI00260D8AA3|nr:pyridoxamine 5'-phosphate oxidase family protein [uncultured Roseibium sp.]